MGRKVGEYLKSNSCSKFRVRIPVVSLSFQREYKKFVRTCESLEGKPFLYAWQGGAHLDSNVTRVKKMLEADFGIVKRWFKDCPESLHLVRFGVTVCVEELETRYPHQKRNLIQAHNADLSIWLKDNYPEVTFLDPYSATLDAMSDAIAPRSADGFHFLSDFNVLYANTILNLMHAISI